MPRKKPREVLLEQKRVAERKRYAEIKKNPEKYLAQKTKDRLKYLKKKEQGKLKSIDQMTPRSQRLQRKNWRETKAKQRARHLQQKNHDKHNLIVENLSSPSENETENLTPVCFSTPVSRQQYLTCTPESVKKKIACYRNRYCKIINKQNKTIGELKRQNEQSIAKYKKRYYRIKQKSTGSKTSPNSSVDIILNSPTPAIRKILLAAEVLKRQLTSNFISLKSERQKQAFTKLISGKIIKKYRVQNYFKNFMKYKRTENNYMKYSPLVYYKKSRIRVKLREAIIKYLESDLNSRLCPGKKDFVKKCGIAKQKRYLTKSLKALWNQFLIEQDKFSVSYDKFRRSCPFWIKRMNVRDRDTCKCIIHENFDLLLRALFNNNLIISIKTHNELINVLCCEKITLDCLSRNCGQCKNKEIHLKRITDENENISFFQWVYVKDTYKDIKTNKIKIFNRMEKQECNENILNLMTKFKLKLNAYLNHERTILHQHLEIKKLKNELSSNDCLIHIDFSENYNLKYCNEVQSFHFGGSRRQITIHTAVIYYKNEEKNFLEKKCFATLSNSLLHNPCAILAHLAPIFKYLEDKTVVKNLHFLSDGPSTQYKNKDMFLLIAQKLQDFFIPLQNFTWNYSETGHGKGAPDGVGGTIKRMADRVVADGGDLPNLKILLEKLIEICPGINIYEINSTDIETISAQMPEKKKIPSFLGTQKVRQVVGRKDLNELEFRSLSCFDSIISSKYKLGVLKYREKLFNPIPVDHNCTESTEIDSLELTDNLSYDSKSKKLMFKDVYTDSSITDNSLNVSNQIKAGFYLLTEFVARQKKLRFAAVAQEDAKNDEIKILGLKPYGKELFFVDESDESYINVNQVIEILPTPATIIKGSRIFYKFPQKINI